MRCHIQYKCIYVYGKDRDTLTYYEPGFFDREDDMYVMSFQATGETITLRYNDRQVILKHGPSVLKLDLTQDLDNDYQAVYGSLNLRTHVVSLEARKHVLKLVYELNQSERLVRVYLLARVVESEGDHEKNLSTH
ncbi:MAG: hypothetical protein ACSW8B_00910 [bacterium]